MRRILLISDAHGNLDIINEKVSQTNADMVIHAGDFGFYDDQSVYRLSPRELRLSVSHSPVWRQYEVDKQASRERLIEINKENKLLGDFPDYISGDKKFSVPVYAVWGNHEDVQVLRELNTDLKIDNLSLLDEHNFYQFHSDDELEFSLYGLGGNFLVSKKLFDKPIAGNGGKVWTVLHQFGVLYKQIKNKSKPSIFVSHVSPGKFTIREMNESLDWLETDIGLIEEQYQQGRLTEEAALAYELIKKPILKEDTWYKKLWNINLPDAKDGHALLIVKDGKFALETYSNEFHF